MIKHKFKKSLGQNYINDLNILKKIYNQSLALPSSTVIEIGTGLGTLTSVISKNVIKVYTFEKDESLKEYLLNKYENSNVEVIIGDFLTYDMEKIKEKDLHVIANIPYYITTLIMVKLLKEKPKIKSLVFLVQKEMGERITSKVKTKDYGRISAYLQSFYSIEKCFNVSKKVFYPVPNVDSMVIKLVRNDVIVNFQKYEEFIKSCFQFKRKNIGNNLKKYDLDIIESILKKYGLSLKSRSEEIDPSIFLEIYKNIKFDKIK